MNGPTARHMKIQCQRWLWLGVHFALTNNKLLFIQEPLNQTKSFKITDFSWRLAMENECHVSSPFCMFICISWHCTSCDVITAHVHIVQPLYTCCDCVSNLVSYHRYVIQYQTINYSGCYLLHIPIFCIIYHIYSSYPWTRLSVPDVI